MKTSYTKPDDFKTFTLSLQDILQNRKKLHIEIDDRRQAAVNIVLMEKNNEPHVLLTKRTHKVSTHKGQISFPGGMRDATDRNLQHTAFRETHEEMGIPENEITPIGTFDDYISIHEVHVTTIVSTIEHPCEYIINEDEIEEYLEVPLHMFITQDYDELRYLTWKGTERELYFYHFEGHEIWGMTARILTDFGKMIRTS